MKNPRLHWNHFLALQEDFGTCARYVEPSTDNDETFSIEFARLLMAATQEIDVVLKMLCALLDATSNASKINPYEKVIQRHLPELKDATICVPRYGRVLKPWQDWSIDSPPAWWTANNKVKHKRNEHFRRANLGNTLLALSALLSVILYYHRHERRRRDKSGEWSIVSQFLGLFDQPMIFELKSPELSRSIGGGQIHNGKVLSELEYDDLDQ